MHLHRYKEEFHDLIAVTAPFIGIPEEAVKRDYYTVLMLQRLAESDFAGDCVFKGGTSLSKCYPGSIERFSEDIDITYLPDVDSLSNKQFSKRLKRIDYSGVAEPPNPIK